MSQLPVDKFSLDSTVGEILGEPKGNPPSRRLVELIGQVLAMFEGEGYVAQSVFNDIDITFHNYEGLRLTSLLLKEGIEYELFALTLKANHHHGWHKPISLGGWTLAPFDRIVPMDKIGSNASGWKDYPQWYPSLEAQLTFFKDHPEKVDEVYQKLDVLPQIAEIREIIKRDYSSGFRGL